jgi:hypothetical protein
MARTAIRCTVGVVRVIGVGVAVLGLSLAWVQTPANAQEAPSLEMWDFGVVPRPALTQVLIQFPAVQQELKITEAQKKEHAEIQERRSQQIRKARTEIKDRAKFLKARDAIFNETAAAQRASLKPEQRERLSQIQLQAQGPLAFSVWGGDPSSESGDLGQFVGPPVSKRLKMSDDQMKRARTIAEEGAAQIQKAASFRLPWDSKDKPSMEAIRERVEGQEFRAAKEKARRAARETWNAVIARIEAVLTDEQRASYRKVLGQPFDLAKLRFEPGQSETDADVQAVGQALGMGGQRADPGFDVTVAHPTFTSWRPRVAIDEAHNNFHTADGRYKPFADLMTHDGCQVSRNTEKLNNQTLDRCEILVIANASVADPGEDAGRPSSAFTEDECAAIQRWVWAGGALLLITDHEPFGSASVALAQRFGVVMNTSGTTDPANADEKTGGLVFTRERQLIVDHPITIGRDPTERINRIETFYGQAIYGPVGSTPFLRFADTASYESANGEQSAAGWSQGLALSYGAGRVVVMGEAAELSAQLAGLEPMGMNVPGIDNRQMALNIMRWLSGALEPRTTAVTAGVTDRTLRQRRPFPRLFSGSLGRRSTPACVVVGW